ncbi:MAG TPA: FAD-dependent oxidoreductase [Actinomycetota bacterium]|nr:FAD-dependent oxidoreductase [Actinomycetota bacterium]
MPTFAVVGASLAGGRAVETLRDEGFDGRVVLIGAEPDRPYERPPLSKEVLRSESKPDSVFLRDDSWYAEHDIELRLGTTVTSLAPGELRLDDTSTLSFDACLISTGGRVRTLDVPGVELPGVGYLRTLRDASALATRFAQRPRVVVVGAGFIGAEVAASARTLRCDVTMIEVLEVPLARVLGEDLGRLYAQIHRDHGVDLRLGEGVERFEGSDRVEAVVGTSGTRYPADIVVIGVGIVPNVELADAAGIDCDNGILVDDRCRTSMAGVFAAGDVANRPDDYSGGRIRVEHFQNAQNQGPAAARNMLGRDTPFQEVPWFWTDQYEVNLQMLGHPSAGAERVVRGDPASRDFVALYVRGGNVVAAIAMNRGKDIAAARRLIERKITVDTARLGDEDVALRDLLRS